MSNSPIIIAGCGRSGTTYLKSLIDAHPDVFIPSESLFIVDYLRAENHWLKPIFKKLFWKEPQLKAWYKGRKFNFNTFTEAIELTHRIEANLEKKSIWGQKTPRFIRYKKLIDLSFPSSKWIFIVRDPRSVVASMIESRTHFYSLYYACKRWNLDNSYLLKNRYDNNVHFVFYEDLLQHPEQTLNKIFDFLKIQTYPINFLINNAKIREFHGSKFNNLSIKKGFSPDKNKINNWNSRLSNKQVNAIEYYTKDIMNKIGYSQSILFPAQPSFMRSFSIKDLLILSEYIRKWPEYLLVTSIRKVLLIAKFRS